MCDVLSYVYARENPWYIHTNTYENKFDCGLYCEKWHHIIHPMCTESLTNNFQNIAVVLFLSHKQVKKTEKHKTRNHKDNKKTCMLSYLLTH